MACARVVAGMAVAAMIVKTGGEICLDRYDLLWWMGTMKNTIPILMWNMYSVQELTDNTVEAEVLETLKEVVRIN